MRARCKERILLFGCAAIGLSLLFGLLSVEIGFRIATGDRYRDLTLNYFPPGSVIYDEVLGWNYRPGYAATWHYFEYAFDVRIDERGLRVDDGPPAPATAPRILFLGDSFTFGVGVDAGQTFVEQTEARLRAAGLVTECLNAGRVGAGTRAARQRLEQLIDATSPTLVIHAFFPENDLADDWLGAAPDAARFTNHGGEPYVNGEPLAAARTTPTGPLFRNSAFYRWLRMRIPGSINLGENPYQGMWFDERLIVPPDWVPAAEALTRAEWAAMQARCETRGAAFAVVLIPSDYDVDDRLWGRIVKRYGVARGHREEGYDRELPFAWAAQAGRDLGIPALNLRPLARAAHARRGEPLYFQHDRHFTAAGHGLAAEAIAGFIQDAGLLPGGA